VKVITDSTGNNKEKTVKVIVRSGDDLKGDMDADRYEKQRAFTWDIESDLDNDHSHVIVIKDGDSIRVIEKDIQVECMPHGSLNWESMPPMPDMPEHFYFYGHPESGDMEEFHFEFKNDSIDTAFVFTHTPEFEFYLQEEEMEKAMKEQQQAMKEFELQYEGEDMERAMREYERAMQEYEIQHRDMERQLRDREIYVMPPASPVTPFEWYGASPELPDRSTEKVIRQELREDGLVSHGRSYIIEISSKAMYINGEKQSKEVAKKYMHLVEGLEPGMLDNSGTFKLVF